MGQRGAGLGDGRGNHPTMRVLSAIICLLALCATGAVRAAECPGNPDALGTSRVIVVDPTEHTRLGTMQYHETLPLDDHEVVLTFDDGPLPPYTTRALDILASQCVKATYFLVGKMAQSFPDVVRHIYAAGHTIGTHSLSHPLTFHRMPLEKAEQEVQGGIASVAAALGDPAEVAPFFRIPGLLRADSVEQYLASRSLMTWSADFPADDWKHIQASEILRRAISRLEAKGKGVLLLHDIQPATVLALPGLLKELKQRGYRIVHVQAATPDRPKTATLPAQWFPRGPGGALGDPADVAPFFRIPGLLRADAVEQYLASRSLMTWSADFPADDWKHIQASEIIRRAISRLEAKGKGVLLLHDIKPATVLALPGLLKELKKRGYRVVHVQAATPDRPKTATLPSQWFLRGSGGALGANWPQAPTLTIAMLLAVPALPAPAPESFGIGHPFGPTMSIVLSPPHPPRLARHAIPLPPRSVWPREADEAPTAITIRTVLPVPSPESFGYGDRFAPAVTPTQTRASLTEPTPPTTGTHVATPAGETLGTARGKPGGWPVTTGAIPKTGFP